MKVRLEDLTRCFQSQEWQVNLSLLLARKIPALQES